MVSFCEALSVLQWLYPKILGEQVLAKHHQHEGISVNLHLKGDPLLNSKFV